MTFFSRSAEKSKGILLWLLTDMWEKDQNILLTTSLVYYYMFECSNSRPQKYIYTTK